MPDLSFATLHSGSIENHWQSGGELGGESLAGAH